MDIKYYKIKYGFDESQYCEITSEELPKAYGMFLMQEGNGVFSDGTALRARDMIRIEPNWHKVRGWNRGWKMEIADYEDIKPLERSYQETQNEAKEIAEYAIKQGKPHLLSKPMSELKGLLGITEHKQPEIKKITENLADKFKIPN